MRGDVANPGAPAAPAARSGAVCPSDQLHLQESILGMIGPIDASDEMPVEDWSRYRSAPRCPDCVRQTREGDFLRGNPLYQ